MSWAPAYSQQAHLHPKHSVCSAGCVSYPKPPRHRGLGYPPPVRPLCDLSQQRMLQASPELPGSYLEEFQLVFSVDNEQEM